jgi:heme/copper-type cytochrome/quinol oxidase subunit 3
MEASSSAMGDGASVGSASVGSASVGSASVGSASAPVAAHIEPEPREWQPRALWVSGRMLCGVISFFFMAFLFAYFYLRALNTNHAWKVGAVNPSLGLGTSIMALLLLSAIIFRLGTSRVADTLSSGIVALVLGLIAVLLQVIEYFTLGFGSASGAYASVFIAWTVLYALVALFGLYWIETQMASLWRARNEEGIQRPLAEGVPADDIMLLRAGIEACSFYWAFFVATGVLAYIILYVV